MKYTEPKLIEAVAASTSYAGVLRHLGLRPAGGTHSHIKRRVTALGLDTSHFTGSAHTRGGQAFNRKTAAEILVVLPKGSNRPKYTQLHRALGEVGVEYKCVECGNTGEWNGKPLTLEIDHIDGDFLNNVQGNLRYLCPNCHSQQETNRSWRLT